jgi:protein-arginine kinase activator protein McsA
MKCDNCEKSASVHLVDIMFGRKTQRHLCAECAQTHTDSHPGPISEILTNFVLSHIKPSGVTRTDPKPPADAEPS